MLKLISSQLFVLAVLGTEPEVCAVTNAGSFGGWDDVSCDSVNTYICEIPASKIFFVITYIWYCEGTVLNILFCFYTCSILCFVNIIIFTECYCTGCEGY
jgi:hypothetical protein